MIDFVHQWITFFTDSPALRLMQLGLLGIGAILIYLVFFTTRDILLRTNSLLYQFASILLVAALPIVGFLLYFLIRPARTIKARELEQMLQQLLANEATRHVQPIRSQEKTEKISKKSVSAAHRMPTLAFDSTASSQSSDCAVSPF